MTTSAPSATPSSAAPGSVALDDHRVEDVPRAHRIGAWVALAVFLLAAFAATARYTGWFIGPFVLPDELGYMKQAVHMADTLSPSTEGDMWFNSYAQLVPALFAIPYGLFDAPTAFRAAHVLQAALYVSAGIPAFLLARQVTGWLPGALIAAALTVVTPWLAMSATLMTEPAAVALTAWCALAFTRAIAAPSVGRDAVALLAVLVTVLARTQLVLLGAALLAAILAHEVLVARSVRRGVPAALRGHPLAFGAAAFTGLVLLLLPNLNSVLGAYGSVTQGSLLPEGLVDRGLELLSYFAVGVVVLPLALAIAFVGATLFDGARASTPARAFAVVLPAMAFAVWYGPASFTAKNGVPITDRYLAFLVPLVAVGAAALLSDRRRRTRSLVAAGVLTALVVGFAEFGQVGRSLISVTMTTNVLLSGRANQVGQLFGIDDLGIAGFLAGGVVVACVALAFARRFVTPRVTGLVVGVVLVLAGIGQTAYVMEKNAQSQRGAPAGFLDSRDWVDEAVGEQKVSGILAEVFDGGEAAEPWWNVNFFNESVDRLVRFDRLLFSQGFARIGSVDRATGRLVGVDSSRLLLLSLGERRFGLRGQEMLASRDGLQVVRAQRPYTAAWTLAADDGVGTVNANRTGLLSVQGDGRARTVRVKLVLAPGAFATRGVRARVVSGGRTVVRDIERNTNATVTVPVRVPARGPSPDVQIVTADVLPGPDPDNGAGMQVQNVEIVG